MNIPSIVKGNDFTIKVYVYKPTYIDNNTTLVDFDLHNCSSINVFLINGADSYAVEYTIDDTENNLIKVIVDYVLPVGSYGIEITGKDNSGKNWRFKAKKGEFMNIIDATSGADFNNDLLEDGLYVTARMGILGIDMDDYYNKEEIEHKLEEINTIVDYNDIVNKPYIPTKVSDLTNDSNYVVQSQLDEQTIISSGGMPTQDLIELNQYSGYDSHEIYYPETYWDKIEYITISLVEGPVSLVGIYDYKENVNEYISIDFTAQSVAIYVYDNTSSALMYHDYLPDAFVDATTVRLYRAPHHLTLNTWGNTVNLGATVTNSSYSTKTVKQAVLDLQNDVNSLSYQYVSKQELVNSSYVQSWQLSDYAQNYRFNDYYTKSEMDDATYITSYINNTPIAAPYYRGWAPTTAYLEINNIGNIYEFKIKLESVNSPSMSVTFDYGYSRAYANIDTDMNTVSFNEYELVYGMWDGTTHPITYTWEGNIITFTLSTPTNYVTIDPVASSVSYDALISDTANSTNRTSLKNAVIDIQNEFSYYYTKDEINNAGYLQSHQSLEAYPTRSDISNMSYVTQSDLSAMSYLQQHQSLDNYYTKEEINNASYLQEHQSLDGYYTKEEINNAAYLQSHQSLEAYPTKQEIVEASYVTSSALSEMAYLQNHQSLDNYYTKSEIQGMSYVSQDALSNMSYLQQHQSLDNYYTKNEINNAGYLQSHQSLDNYYTKSDIENASYVTQSALSSMSYLQQHQSLDDYYTKSEINNAGYLQSHQSLDNYYTKEQINNAGYLQSHQSLSGYATETWVNDKFEDMLGINAEGVTSLANVLNDEDKTTGILSEIGRKANSTDVYTKGEINSMGYLQSHQSLDGYYTKEEINNAAYLQSHQSLDNYYTKSDIQGMSYVSQDVLSSMGYLTNHQSLDGYYTKEEINNAGYLTSHQSLDDYYTKNEINGMGYLQSHQSLEAYPTKQEIVEASYVTQSALSGMAYLQQHQSLDNYYTKSDIQNMSYVSQEALSGMAYLQNHQSLDNYYTKSEIQGMGYLQSHQSLDAYATKQDLVNASYVTNTELSEMGYLQSHQSLANYVTKTDLDNAGYLTSHQSLDGYYTKEEINNAGYLTSHQSLDNYYTKSDINNLGYLTVGDISEMGYLQSHQSLDAYATKEEISNAGYLTSHQSLDNYVTKTDLDNAGYLTSHQSLDNYYTKSDINSLGYLTASDISSMSYLQEHQSLSDYYTKSEIQGMGYLQSHQDLSSYATNDELNDRTIFENFKYNFTSVQGQNDFAYAVTVFSIGDINGVSMFDFYSTNNDLVSIAVGGQYDNGGSPGIPNYPRTVTSFNQTLSIIVDKDESLGLYSFKSNEPIWRIYDIQGSHQIILSVYGSTIKDKFTYYVTKLDLFKASYVTQSDLDDRHYLTSHQSLNNYYTKSAIQGMSYVSKSVLSECSYVTQSDLSSMGYLQSHQSLSDYYTKTEINNAGYLTSHQSLDNYATKSDLISYLSVDNLNTANTKMQFRTNGLTVITTNNTIAPKVLTYAQFNNETNPWVGGTTLKNYVDGRLAEIEASYITSHQSLSDYYTKTEINNAGYLTSHQSLANYVTKTDLDNASYVTTSQLPVIDENIIPKQNNTYTLGNASNIYANTYSRGINLGTGVKIFSESSATSENIAISLGGTSYYYINNNRFAPNGAENSEKLDLGTSDRKWNGVYCKMLNTNVVNFQDGGWLRYGGNQNRLGIFSSTIIPGNNNGLSLGSSTSAWKASYSYNYYTYNDGWQGLNETLEKTITSTTSGLKIEIVASMPADPDANTIYIVQ